MSRPLDAYIGSHAGDSAADAYITAKGWSKLEGLLYFDSTASVQALKIWDGNDWVPLWLSPLGSEAVKSFSLALSGLAAGTYYGGGYYKAPLADANLTQASPSVSYGNGSGAYGAHAFIVAGGPGTTDVGTVSVQVSGTSITDAGVRTAADSETIVADITALALNQYVESSKKWIGQVTFTLVAGGGATTYSLDFNYGFSKYETLDGRDFTVQDFEVEGLAGATDSAFDVELLFHSSTGWTYSAAAFAPGGTVLASLSTDYSTEDSLISGDHFAYRRNNLSQAVAGSSSEGFLVRVTTGQASAVQTMDMHVAVAA
jgi:hypothetical protein